MESTAPFLDSDYPSVISYYSNHIIILDGTRVIGIGALLALSDLSQDRLPYVIDMVRSTRALRGQSIVVRSTTTDKVRSIINSSDSRAALAGVQESTKEGMSYASTIIANEPLLLTSMAVNWLVGAGFIKDKYRILCRYFTNYAPYAEAKLRNIPSNHTELFGTSSVTHDASYDAMTSAQSQLEKDAPVLKVPETGDKYPAVITHETANKDKLMRNKAAFFDSIVEDNPNISMDAAAASLGYPNARALLVDLKGYGYVSAEMPDTELDHVQVSTRVVSEIRLFNSRHSKLC